MSTTINVTAGKQVGELAKTYEALTTLLEQATLKRNDNTPIVAIAVVSPIPGDSGNLANSIAALMTSTSQSVLDQEFIDRLNTQISVVKAAYEAQVVLAVAGDEPADPEQTPETP